MTVKNPLSLEQLLRLNGLEWLIQGHPGPAISSYLRLLHEASQESRRRFGDTGPQFTEDALAHEFQQNPYRVRAFLQALGAARTAEMLLMAWRILQGLRIQELDMSYRERKNFHLRCVLNASSPYEDSREIYQSSDIADALLLRHFGVVDMIEGPVFEGFYPLAIASKAAQPATSSD